MATAIDPLAARVVRASPGLAIGDAASARLPRARSPSADSCGSAPANAPAGISPPARGNRRRSQPDRRRSGIGRIRQSIQWCKLRGPHTRLKERHDGRSTGRGFARTAGFPVCVPPNFPFVGASTASATDDDVGDYARNSRFTSSRRSRHCGPPPISIADAYVRRHRLEGDSQSMWLRTALSDRNVA